MLSDLKQGAGDTGGFGFDGSGSPDLCAFGYAEADADRDGNALMLVGSSGTLLVTVNEQPIYQFKDAAGRGYAPDSDTVLFRIKKGKNRILVQSRQGVGAWCYSVQFAPLEPAAADRMAATTADDLRRFALAHRGDARKGEAIFFSAQGAGCAVPCRGGTRSRRDRPRPHGPRAQV